MSWRAPYVSLLWIAFLAFLGGVRGGQPVYHAVSEDDGNTLKIKRGMEESASFSPIYASARKSGDYLKTG